MSPKVLLLCLAIRKQFFARVTVNMRFTPHCSMGDREMRVKLSAVTYGSGRKPHIAYLVKRIERAIRFRLDAVLAPTGVTTPEYTALSILGADDGVSSAELSRRAFVTPQAMNQIVLALEGRGLVRRKISAHHGRVMTTSLTAKGKATLEACDRAALRIEDHLLKILSKADAVVLRRVLSACVDALSDNEPSRK